jgi:hypothetical protein
MGSRPISVHLLAQRSVKLAVATLCGAVMLGSLSGCHSDDAAGGPPVKLGTDTLPQAPNQGSPPGVIGKDGSTTTPSAPSTGLPLPGNKGKH